MVKKFRSREDALATIKIFKSLNRRNERRTIELLATFSINDQYFLMFPAAYSSLGEFWQGTTPNFGRDTMLWLAKECYEIASCLYRIHSRTEHSENSEQQHNNLEDAHISGGSDRNRCLFLHANINHNNTLLFNTNTNNDLIIGYPKLVISQIREFQPTFEQGLFELPTGDSITCRPPETETEMYCGLNYDIWALGCLYLESITWILEDWDGVDRFSRERLEEDRNLMNTYLRSLIAEDKFFTCLGYGPPEKLRAIINPAVTKVSSNSE